MTLRLLLAVVVFVVTSAAVARPGCWPDPFTVAHAVLLAVWAFSGAEILRAVAGRR